MSEEPNPTALFALLDDEYARGILTETSREPMSAQTLSDRCDASLPTIYRRLDDLESCDLVEKRTRPASDGNHYALYEATVEHIGVYVRDGEIDVYVGDDEDEDAADRFTDVWEDMRGDER
ncbi:ArsR/SmtB family transcription factor [Halorussus salinisoli]|uniref:ArsR/SmtB family transcription factor n=1 Tax=Halorussus salinisoli TaxID=2558242 RepID=UPI0010C175A4|nr:winged helix-turn-helix domain-containing protein [Halorussus salinisoli]